MSSINPLTVFHKCDGSIHHPIYPNLSEPTLSVAFLLHHSETLRPISRLSPDGISRIALILTMITWLSLFTMYPNGV